MIDNEPNSQVGLSSRLGHATLRRVNFHDQIKTISEEMFTRNRYSADLLRWCSYLLFTSYTLGADTFIHLNKQEPFGDDPSREHYFTPLEGRFTLWHYPENAIDLEFQTSFESTNRQRWTFSFAAPAGQTIQRGFYPTRAHHPYFTNSEPGMTITANGGICSDKDGYFFIKEVTYGAGFEVRTFWAQFEFHCEGRIPAITGEIRYNVQTPIALDAPLEWTVRIGESVMFPVVLRDELGGPAAELGMPAHPPGAELSVNGEGSAQFHWTPGAGQVGQHRVRFVAERGGSEVDRFTTLLNVHGETSLILNSDTADPLGQGRSLEFNESNSRSGMSDLAGNGVLIWFAATGTAQGWSFAFAPPKEQLLTTGTFEDARRLSFSQGAGQAGLDIGLTHLVCGELNGRFEVHQIAYAPNGRILSFWATFEQQCQYADGGLRGEVRFNVDPYPPANRRPEVTCSPQVVTCPPRGGATIALTAQISDPEGDAVSLIWEIDGKRVRTDRVPAGQQAPVLVTLRYPFPAGLAAVRLVVRDSAGNTNYCYTTTHAVIDQSPPQMACPSEILRTNDPACGWAKISLNPPLATDDCSTPVVTARRSDKRSLQAPFPIGYTSVLWTAVDGFGNESSCLQYITVVDRQRPRVRCQPYVPIRPIASSAGSRGYYFLEGRDNSPGPVYLTVSDTGSNLSLGPFRNKVKVQILRDPSNLPRFRFDAMSQALVIRFKGDARVYAFDSSGNQSLPVYCVAAEISPRATAK